LRSRRQLLPASIASPTRLEWEAAGSRPCNSVWIRFLAPPAPVRVIPSIRTPNPHWRISRSVAICTAKRRSSGDLLCGFEPGQSGPGLKCDRFPGLSCSFECGSVTFRRFFLRLISPGKATTIAENLHSGSSTARVSFDASGSSGCRVRTVKNSEIWEASLTRNWKRGRRDCFIPVGSQRGGAIS
jgi:hypothetical protein